MVTGRGVRIIEEIQLFPAEQPVLELLLDSIQARAEVKGRPGGGDEPPVPVLCMREAGPASGRGVWWASESAPPPRQLLSPPPCSLLLGEDAFPGPCLVGKRRMPLGTGQNHSGGAFPDAKAMPLPLGGGRGTVAQPLPMFLVKNAPWCSCWSVSCSPHRAWFMLPRMMLWHRCPLPTAACTGAVESVSWPETLTVPGVEGPVSCSSQALGRSSQCECFPDLATGGFQPPAPPGPAAGPFGVTEPPPSFLPVPCCSSPSRQSRHT